MVDFIIIGAGSAGCILANRLSADPSVQVTLLEAGGKDKSFLYRMPAGAMQLMKTGQGNWKYETTPQPGLNGRRIYFPRGKVLGGSSSVNGQVASRGNAGDYDHWAQLGNQDWSYEGCVPYFKRLENYEYGDDAYRGRTGPIGISLSPPTESMNPISRAWIEGGIQAGHGYNDDANGPNNEGVARMQSNIAGGARQSAATCYLKPVLHRRNLKMITDALVTKLLLKGGRVTGVEYRQKNSLKIITTEREVILSGGVINSPQVLQLSGIGDPQDIRAQGLKVEHELAGVGRNLQDHIAVNVRQRITKPYSLLSHTKPLAAAMAFLKYTVSGSGPMASIGLEAWAHLKSRIGLEYPNLQIFCLPIMYEDHGRLIIPEEGFMAIMNGSRPYSTGTVKICSDNPAVHPTIDPNYLADAEDIRILRAGIKLSREIIAQQAYDDMRGEEYAPGSNVTSDDELDDYIRSTASTNYHPVGTCKMGSDSMAVVDSTLRVRGLDGLRVIDASIMPSLPSGNTNLPTMMIAEKAADMILNGTKIADLGSQMREPIISH